MSKLSEAKHHISVQIDVDELDLTAAESKATYKEIQAWVQEKYGFHVPHLNIAQVKRKNGIIERENYNKPKLENSRQMGQNIIVKSSVPTQSISSFYYSNRIDTGIFKSGTLNVYGDKIGLFNSLVQGTIEIMK